ncbi:oxaloacetate decarboxylase [Gelria sp. Kuro-4]|uniref:isocitrate lyase/PEP mutase family protein n=1 Tax=Gelria sp. Kuro-4 TaxID=2796927 RepID=UPI001BED7AF2|nr:isocitrate lyase/PEP mutase family protein [Gelria sp. Kuro-4]BCV26010.1 carboxyvinyl-carboxyphosphonate phosphorylmutase [Gelria sp. Kuro-4]
MRKTTLLKKLINDPEILVMPGAYDVLSARLIEAAGFRAVQCSGFGFAASFLGLPDIGILSSSQMLELTRNICHAVDIPVMADGDNGFGNPVNTHYTVREFEAAGAAGINLEDQVSPKRCGHITGKQIIPAEEMVLKIQAAREAAGDPDFVINARTDAYGVAGIEEAIRRGNLYAKAGADLIFVEAPLSVEGIKRVIREIDAPVSINLLQGGRTPLVTIQELEEWGAARVSIPVTTVMAAAYGVKQALEYIKAHGSIRDLEGVLSFAEFTDLVGLDKIRELEARYLTEEEIALRYGGREGLASAAAEHH